MDYINTTVRNHPKQADTINYSNSNSSPTARKSSSNSKCKRYHSELPPQPTQRRPQSNAERKRVLLDEDDAVRRAQVELSEGQTEQVAELGEVDIQEQLNLQGKVSSDEEYVQVELQLQLER